MVIIWGCVAQAEWGGRGREQQGGESNSPRQKKIQSLHNSEEEKLKMIFIFFIWRRIHYLAQEQELSAVSQE